jgi:hypothetical protein
MPFYIRILYYAFLYQYFILTDLWQGLVGQASVGDEGRDRLPCTHAETAACSQCKGCIRYTSDIHVIPVTKVI